LSVNVELNVTVSGPDFTNGIYDKEEWLILTFDSVSREEILKLEFNGEFGLSYEFSSGALERVDCIDFFIPTAAGGIEISVEELPEPD